MKERPILFNSDMVNAILEGRKFQTRRVIKTPEPFLNRDLVEKISVFLPKELGCFFKTRSEAKLFAKCPYGKVGDQLWVKETWATGLFYDDLKPSDLSGEENIIYRADEPDLKVGRWRPNIFMPRWASRIQLEITDIRVERLNDIKESDCLAEGVGSPITRDCKKPKFMQLWESINGKGSWDENPWVWVVEFKKL